ncbi:phosphonoacetaldehyde hydrolase [Enterococcus sp. DIV1298c]|uniref:phosphonoacetaldehyde hydrolase n=1 Tax=Enterococcus sp. DIV1298c TaxID=2815328 RepID=UPI001A9285F0|nr:phosphonoacetaldehyde hydrolase [Enterococcus sp. DIV1298c]MBO0460828.1 phosphonoacetaldehyde hydrolase [Enterococcus sp. DIV1298c]
MIKVVILDWAGTAVDFGCMAPVAAFREAFERQGITVTEQEIREPMGMKKIEHIKRMLEMPRIAESWLETHGQAPTTADIEAIYATFEEVLFQQLANHAEVKPGVLDTVAVLRNRGIKIGSTTGYTSEMMEIVVAEANAQGYQPDHIVTPDEVDGKGRPAPEMLLTNLAYFKQENNQEVLKLGDTISDILEGKNAGVISVGVIEGSSQAGYSFDAYQQLSEAEKEALFKRVRREYLEAGADYVIDQFSELSALIETIEAQQVVTS